MAIKTPGRPLLHDLHVALRQHARQRAFALTVVVTLIPGLKSPTVVSLAERGMVAVHAVVDEDHVTSLVPQLKKAGASGILVLPIERMVP